MRILIVRSQHSLIFAVLLLLASCQSSVRFSSGNHSTNDNSKKIVLGNQTKALTSLQRRIITSAEKYLGIPYCWGGAGNDCMDCSGFVQRVYSDVGISLPRTAAEQFNTGKFITPNETKAGDLIFFSFTGSGITHVGIFAGNNEVIHASSSGGVVRQTLADSYLSAGYAGVRRVVGSLSER